MGALTFKTIEALRDQGRYPDSAGLYLLVSKTGAKSWLLRVQRDGRRRDLGLGGYPAISLAEARTAAAAMKASVVKGADPTVEKRKRKLLAALPTFNAAALDRYDEVAKTFRNEKHKTQWINSLKTYAFPTIGRLCTAVTNQATGSSAECR